MPGTGLKVCGGGGMVGGMVCKPILVFSLGQAEQQLVQSEVAAQSQINLKITALKT